MKHYLIPSSTYHKLKSVQNTKEEVKPVENSRIIQHEESDMITKKEEEEESSQDLFILEAFPKTIKDRVARLINYIKRYTPKIKWKLNGNVIIDNEIIPKSNIIDLLRKAVTGSSKSPKGWVKFYEALEDINTPLTLITITPPGTPASRPKWLTH